MRLGEIIRAVLDHADDPTLAEAARVSRSWEPHALRVLWDTGIESQPLFRILGDTVRNSNGDLVNT